MWSLWDFPYIVSCHLYNAVVFFLFQFGCLFSLSFFGGGLIAFVKSSNAMLNKSGKNWYSCLVHDLRKKDLSFSLLSMILAIDLYYGLFYAEVWSLYTHFVENFYRKWVLNFVKCFFCL